MRKCHVDVVNVLLEAHAAQDDGDGGVVAMVECPCGQDEEEQAYPLLHSRAGEGVEPPSSAAAGGEERQVTGECDFRYVDIEV